MYIVVMSTIKKFLPYSLIVLDIAALLALQSIMDCVGVESAVCAENRNSPSGIIVIIASFATAFYFYKRYRAKQPLLPFLSFLTEGREATTDTQTSTASPIVNRIFFGFCSFLIMMSYFVEIYHYAKGSDTPPYAHWSIYTFPLLIGLIITTLKEKIELRIHPFWTPFGLLYAAFAWGLVIFDGIPQGNALGYSLFDSIGEGFWFANGLGLMLAFVGLEPLYKRAFYLITLVFFGVLFGGIEFTRQVQVILQNKPIEWGAYLDMTWLAGGYFALFLVVKRLIKDRPPVKMMLKTTGLFLLLIVLNTIVSQNFVSKAFPKKSWPHHWLSGYMPAYKFQCSGVDCENIIYREPYSFCVNANVINRGNLATFYEVAQSRHTKGCRYELNTSSNNLTVICSRPLTASKASSADMPVVTCGPNSRYEGAYGIGLGGSQLRQKELYD